MLILAPVKTLIKVFQVKQLTGPTTFKTNNVSIQTWHKKTILQMILFSLSINPWHDSMFSWESPIYTPSYEGYLQHILTSHLYTQVLFSTYKMVGALALD